MISKLLIVDTDSSEELLNTVTALKDDDVQIITFDLSGGFIDSGTGKNLFVENIMNNIRTLSETESVNLTNIGFVNSKQDTLSKTSSGYTNSNHIIEDIQANIDNLSSWDYLISTTNHLYLVTLIQSLDFIDINHFLYSEHYSTIFNYINSNIRVVEEGLKVNYLENTFDIDIVSDELYCTDNWLYSMMTTFYSDNVKILMDKYFNPTNVLLEQVKEIELKVNINIRYIFNDSEHESQTAINNVILYDLHLEQYLEDVQNSLLSNTVIMTFSKKNSFAEIKKALNSLQDDEMIEITNVALFQNNPRQTIYNIVTEETSTIENVSIEDPSLNTWTKFTDFVLFLEQELNINNFDLLMCKIYSDDNWKYFIENVSSQLDSLEIRSSEDITGHIVFDGDWVLESPAADVNLIGLYFNENIKDVDIHLNGVYVFTTKSELQQGVTDWLNGDTTTYGDISTWDTGNVTNMSQIFQNQSQFNEDISTWKVSNVTDMNHMFYSCSKFNQDLSGWTVSNVTAMNNMFYGCSSFNTSINSWDVSKVKDISWMFRNSGNNGYNQPLDNWIVSNVTNMSYMFGYTKFNQDIGGWDVANCNLFMSMFQGITTFNQDLNSWPIKPTANISSMFNGASSFDQVLDGYYWLTNSGNQTNIFSGTSGSFGTLPDPLTITISTTDLSNNDNSDYGVVNMVITSSSSMTLLESDISLTNGVISEFTKISGTNYSFKVSSNSLTQPTSVSILEDSVYNDSADAPYNEASNTFEWTWSYTLVPPIISISSPDIPNGDSHTDSYINMEMEISNDTLHGNNVESSILPSDVSAENGYIFGVGRNNSTQDYVVTVSDKTSSHPYYGNGSSTGYYIEESSSTDISYIGGTGESYVDIPFSVDNVVYFERPLASGDPGVYEEISGTIADGVKGYYAKGNVLFPDYSSDGFSPGTHLSQDILLFNENDWTVEFFTYPTQDSNGYYTTFIDFGSKGGTSSAVFEILYVNYSFSSYYYKNAVGLGIGHGANGTGVVYNHNDGGSGPAGTRRPDADHTLENVPTDSNGVHIIPLITPNSLNDGKYHHVCLSRKGNTFTGFLNGSIIYQETEEWNPAVTYTVPNIGDGGLRIGAYNSSDNRSFNGNIQDLKIINGVGRDQTFSISASTLSESPTLDFLVGNTYRFDQSDSTNAGHPLQFYEDASKNTPYTTGVTTTGTAGSSGSLVSIQIDEGTPSPLYYQCGNHELMGASGNVKNIINFKLGSNSTTDSTTLTIPENSLTRVFNDVFTTNSNNESNYFNWTYDSPALMIT